MDDEGVTSLSDLDECVCAGMATAKVVGKSDSLRFDKSVVTLATESSAKIAAQSVARSSDVTFESPFYLTDSFYNLAPKRGPPTL